MNPTPEPGNVDGNAVVYCQGAFNTTYGKTAHGLVRFTRRYRVISVIDSRYEGRDARDVLDGRFGAIPVCASLAQALTQAEAAGQPATHFVIGLAPDGGRLDPDTREAAKQAIRAGLNIDSGLHDFLTQDPELSDLALRFGARIRDVRKPPSTAELHAFSGKIEKVLCLKIAVLGTDSAVGKRTTAWLVVNGFRERGVAAELIGTGQTSWMQGARYGLILDSLVNDFVSGEIEHAVFKAWEEGRPDVIVIEGQGSLMNPAYPGGFEILAAARPDLVVLQHAPARKEYDGFPGYPIPPIARHIQLIELISERPVAAIALNHEAMEKTGIPYVCSALEDVTGIPAFDVLEDGPDALLDYLIPFLKSPQGRNHENFFPPKP